MYFFLLAEIFFTTLLDRRVVWSRGCFPTFFYRLMTPLGRPSDHVICLYEIRMKMKMEHNKNGWIIFSIDLITSHYSFTFVRTDVSYWC